MPDATPRISGKTWTLGIVAWLLLIAGAPLMPLGLGGCTGAGLFLASLLLAIVAYVRVLRDTRGGRVGWRALGWLLVPLGMIVLLGSAMEPTSMFGDAVKVEAVNRFHLADPDVPDGVMLRSTYWQLHPLLRHLPWWIGSAALMAGGMRLIGERRPGWLAAVGLLSAATGPLVLRISLKLLEAGFRS